MNTLTVKSDLKTKLSKIDVVYLVKNGKITEFFDFDGVLVPRGTILSDKDTLGTRILFTDKFEALYHNMLECISNGKPLSNYNHSKYFSRYVERLNVEHPEYVL